MPSSVADLFAAASLCPAGDVRWGDSPSAPKPGGFATGVYIVALTDQHDVLTATLAAAPISIPAVQGLLDARPECRIREQRPTAKILAARLARFWFPDEVVLYIGRAGPRKRRLPQGEVAKRVSDYYRTALGKRSPHRGGWFLKTLSNLDELHIHYGYTDDFVEAEKRMVGHFAKHASAESRAALYDSVNVMPFANLEYPDGARKLHEIEHATPTQTRRRSPRGRALTLST